MDDIRWWAVDDLAACPETAHPVGLAQMLPDIIAGRYPETPREIAWR